MYYEETMIKSEEYICFDKWKTMQNFSLEKVP